MTELLSLPNERTSLLHTPTPLLVTDVSRHDNGFAITFDNGTVSLLSATELAAKLSGSKASPLEVDLDISQYEAVAAQAALVGLTPDEFIESAVIEKLLRVR